MSKLFSSKIVCLRCKKKFKYKIEYGKPHYLCSTYSNFGKESCDRQAISEIELVFLVEKHMFLHKIDREKMSIEEYVDRIEKNGDEFTIYYVDDTTTIISNNRVVY